ncbi:uncharacterized protein LOC129909397 [Episyrphus balteatus]|uniref:uncharacterized protein LOC129909397 n=1 Tax=Episyrphus balteatus TaxID=286459 RepID=UPI002485E8A1|nr:uncharacterized protein LOC129909397 [Episyrphus balteatus]
MGNQKLMFLIAFVGYLAITSALPAPQLLAPAATLTAIPAPHQILILTPQAQVQLEPSLKFPVQNLARIESPIEQTLLYVPSENIISAYPKVEGVQQGKQLKQLETSNITNVVNQFVTAGQTVQAELQALQQQLSQGLENIIQPGQKIEGSPVGAEVLKSGVQLLEIPRQESGRFYSVPAPQFYSNFEAIHAPLSPLFAVQPISAIRARSVVHPEDKVAPSAPAQENVENLAKIAEGVVQQQAQANENQARNTETASLPVEQVQQADNFDDKSLKVQKENEQAPANSQFGKFLGSIEKRIDSPEIPASDANVAELKQLDNQGISIAEAIPAGLAISGEGGLAQAKPIASAISGKDGISYSAPSGTAISGKSDIEKSPSQTL